MKIDNVVIKNFKSLKDIGLKLNNLTLITGVNSSGKSSFIQSLLFFKQNTTNIFLAYCINKLGKDKNNGFLKSAADFNGEYLDLGDVNLLHSQESLDENIVFEISSKAISSKVKNARITVNSKLEITCNEGFAPEILNMFGDDKCDFNYLSTDRISPASTFPLSSEQIEKNSIGLKGEYTTHYLAENRHQELGVKALKHPESETLQLLENTYKWMGEISSGISISASADPSTQSAKLTYQYEYGEDTTSNYSPLNVGFGLTYVLPVIVLILKSKPGDLLIIENPESHLHPKGQSKIAELCAIAAHNGVQIIVETHSDHFLNGLRVATKNKIITPENSQIYYFEKGKNNLDTVAHPINIDENGKINDWPKGFFDEWDKQLDKLLW